MLIFSIKKLLILRQKPGTTKGEHGLIVLCFCNNVHYILLLNINLKNAWQLYFIIYHITSYRGYIWDDVLIDEESAFPLSSLSCGGCSKIVSIIPNSFASVGDMKLSLSMLFSENTLLFCTNGIYFFSFLSTLLFIKITSLKYSMINFKNIHVTWVSKFWMFVLNFG